jgi:hypothetical protein
VVKTIRSAAKPLYELICANTLTTPMSLHDYLLIHKGLSLI